MENLNILWLTKEKWLFFCFFSYGKMRYFENFSEEVSEASRCFVPSSRGRAGSRRMPRVEVEVLLGWSVTDSRYSLHSLFSRFFVANFIPLVSSLCVRSFPLPFRCSWSRGKREPRRELPLGALEVDHTKRDS